MELIVKKHPNDTRDTKPLFNKGITISNAIEKDCFDLLYDADYVFAVFSSLLYQAKLINENCYSLAIFDAPEMEIYGIYEGQNSYSKYLEIVKTEDMLDKILKGEHKTTSCEYYIKEINPDFGHVAAEFKKFIEGIS